MVEPRLERGRGAKYGPVYIIGRYLPKITLGNVRLTLACLFGSKGVSETRRN